MNMNDNENHTASDHFYVVYDHEKDESRCSSHTEVVKIYREEYEALLDAVDRNLYELTKALDHHCKTLNHIKEILKTREEPCDLLDYVEKQIVLFCNDDKVLYITEDESLLSKSVVHDLYTKVIRLIVDLWSENEYIYGDKTLRQVKSMTISETYR